ncbi:hypothetical protein FM117_09690 [Micrococcus luteus Mu201]|nr:hypothetical protein FM117_09690 [Micrococcus luteus Mu201]
MSVSEVRSRRYPLNQVRQDHAPMDQPHGFPTVDGLIGPSSVVRRRLRAYCTGLTD